MVLSHEQDKSGWREKGQFHPYWYARILGIFHFVVQLLSEDGNDLSEPQRVEVLWVRWYGTDPERDARSGWKAQRLPRVGFVPCDGSEADTDAFGFLDPADVIRGVHLIPAFRYGKSNEILPGRSIARAAQEDDEDYKIFYVNM